MMTPLEAARRLATGQRLTHPCAYCGHVMPNHDASCPIHALPQIVAALEAAERVVTAQQAVIEAIRHRGSLAEADAELRAADLALVAALKGTDT